MTDENAMPGLLMIGLGDLGKRIARLCVAHDWPVTVMRRQAIDEPGMRVVTHDATKDWSAALPEDMAPPADVVFCLAPSERDEAGYEAAYLKPAEAGLAWLQANAPKAHVWLISSTSVYGQKDGEWLTESSTAEPKRPTARIIRAAERFWKDSPQPVTVLRPAGLYGPGRDLMLRQAREGYTITDNLPVFTNRIHVDDAAAAVAHLIRQRRKMGRSFDVVNLADREPVAQQILVPELQAMMGVEPTGEERLLDRGSKRVSSDRLMATGFQWQYPSWREGYAAMLEASSAPGG
ncbi:MAG: hypothetical protein LAT62_14560 [Natronospirillum sp.]|uniref:NAD-dependent epimerase/dehydratase family protein n=1 Tax=Natronospirillum sp. TaxID=2812955 RepID=UPI0025EAC325|nr:NAD(P)H-binding protein [Natronospirillum sp.]MCH8553157.1 hypothetical protein [Natronospirillum sp.]